VVRICHAGAANRDRLQRYFVGVLTALLIYFYWTRKRGDTSLADAGMAMGLFRDHFTEAAGTATLTADRRNALIDLSDGTGVGLLLGHGHRWNAHLLRAGDVASVLVSRLRARGLSLLLVASDQPSLALVLGLARGSSFEPTLQPVGEPAAELDLAVQRSHAAECAARVARLQPCRRRACIFHKPPLPVLDPHRGGRSHARLGW
jgi:hypothetical protein